MYNYESIKNLFRFYPNIHRPPECLLNKNILDKLDWDKTVVYTTELEGLSKLLSERDPVNIEQDRYLLSNSKMKKIFKSIFGYNQSYYQSYYNKHGSIPQNVAVYCRTPVFGYNIKIDIINVIGFAFDTRTQPDYLYFKKIQNPSIEFKIYITNIFNYIAQCSDDICNNDIALSGFGSGEFSKYFSNAVKGFSYKKIYIECFLKSKLNNDKYNLYMLGGYYDNVLKKITYGKQERRIEHIGWVPHCFESYPRLLFVNAWDPHSIAGNGNKSDNSLDGHFGRLTAISVLCWPLSNKRMNLIT